MNNRLKILSPSLRREEAKAWDLRAEELRKTHPIKNLERLPKMVGITLKTARYLKLKALLYLIGHDEKRIFPTYFFKRPFFYTKRLIRSYFNSAKRFTRKGDLFFYGLQNEEEFQKIILKENPVILIGFSYCHKPFECPSGRFTDACQNDPEHPVCGQCFIGKCSRLAERTEAELLYIPTIHHIGEKIFQAERRHPNRSVLFLITACEMTLTMFADWGNMVGSRGIGIRLDGRICNTMQAFKLSEKGIKPGLTVVLDETKQKMVDLIAELPTRKDASSERVSDDRFASSREV